MGWHSPRWRIENHNSRLLADKQSQPHRRLTNMTICRERSRLSRPLLDAFIAIMARRLAGRARLNHASGFSTSSSCARETMKISFPARRGDEKKSRKMKVFRDPTSTVERWKAGETAESRERGNRLKRCSQRRSWSSVKLNANKPIDRADFSSSTANGTAGGALLRRYLQLPPLSRDRDCVTSHSKLNWAGKLFMKKEIVTRSASDHRTKALKSWLKSN